MSVFVSTKDKYVKQARFDNANTFTREHKPQLSYIKEIEIKEVKSTADRQTTYSTLEPANSSLSRHTHIDRALDLPTGNYVGLLCSLVPLARSSPVSFNVRLTIKSQEEREFYVIRPEYQPS